MEQPNQARKALTPAAPPHLVAYDVTTFVEFVKRHGPTTEIWAYVDAFTLVALVEGAEAIRIQLRSSEAIKIVQGRSGQPICVGRLAETLRAVDSWEGFEEGRLPIGGSRPDSIEDDYGTDLTRFVCVSREVSRPGHYFGTYVQRDVDHQLDDSIEEVNLPGWAVAQVRFFDRAQYPTPCPLDFRFSYQTRDGRLETTYILPRFRDERHKAFLDVVRHVADETGARPLVLASELAAASPQDPDLAAIEALRPGETWTRLLVDASPYNADGGFCLSLRAFVDREPDGRYSVGVETCGHNYDWRVWDSDGLTETVGVSTIAEVGVALAFIALQAQEKERRYAQDAPIESGVGEPKEAA